MIIGSLCADSAAAVTEILQAQVVEAGVDYVLCQFAFGDISLAEALRSARCRPLSVPRSPLDHFPVYNVCANLHQRSQEPPRRSAIEVEEN